ncbi:MAG: glycosyltransferase [Lachnospiraceae bacterium]|nr:glycosyltransferase [Lachnospiraceae bacterium]
MRIAILIGALQKGGTERVAVNIIDHMLSRGHEIILVTQYKKENEYPLNKTAKRIISDITEAETTDSRIINFYRRFKKLRRIWQSEKPDLILSFIGKNNMMAVMTGRFLSIPVTVAVRGMPEAEYPSALEKYAAFFIYRFAEGILLQTEESRNFFPPHLRRKLSILRNPISSRFFRERYEGERDKTIVAVGRIDDNKNHRLLIQAFARLADKYPEYQVIIYGEGDLKETLKEEAALLKLSDRIHFPGNSDCIEEDIYRASIYVLCSDTEGSPNTLIEAMLLGLACIATDCPCGGPGDLIEHGENGFLTQVRSIEKMKENLQHLLENPHLINQIGVNAHKLKDIYDPQTIYESWEKYLTGFKK